jgi:tetratricopeptide (TPR) repeat protein
MDEFAVQRWAGRAALAAGDYRTAEVAFAAVVARAPHDADALGGLADAFLGGGHVLAAANAARRAIAAAPQHVAAYVTRAYALARMGDYRGTVAALESARERAPHDVAVLQLLANAYTRENRIAEARTAIESALAIEPDAPDSRLVLAKVLRIAGQLDDAEREISAALEAGLASAATQVALAEVALDRGAWDDASAAYERALALAPDLPEARYGRALAQLRAGNYRAGFAEYAAILELRDSPGYFYRAAGVPLWDGSPLGDRRLVIASEQGLGDQIMIARFFPHLAAVGPNVTIEAPAKLYALFVASFPHLTFREYVRLAPIDSMDVHLPNMQLPHVLGVADDLAPEMPYLRPSAAALDAMRGRIAPEPAKRQIGIVWRGNPKNPRQRLRGTTLADWEPLRSLAGVTFHSLQIDAGEHECATAPFAFASRMTGTETLDETAALMASLDLIISVDTSSVHLAGALARPVWLANPLASDYRWGTDGESTPWYPTMRIFRQPALEAWQPVFERIAAALRSDGGVTASSPL